MKVSVWLIFSFCLIGALTQHITVNSLHTDLGEEIDLDALEDELANLLTGIFNKTINTTNGLIINGIVDKIFAHTRNLMAKYKFDAIPLPDETFKAKHLAHGNIHDGTLNHLQTIHRADNVIVTYNPQQKIVILQFPFGFDELKIHYDVHVKSKLFKTHGSVDADLKHVIINPILSFNYHTKTLSLDHFDMKHTGNISVRVHIKKAINWLINAISKTVTHVMHPRIVREIQSKTEKILRKSIVKLNVDIKKKIHV